MSDLKATAGEWRVHKATKRIIEIRDALGRVVVAWLGFDGLKLSQSEIDANAHLIAAAPELYAALATLQHYLVDENPGGFAGDAWLVKLNEQASAALKKARGEA